MGARSLGNPVGIGRSRDWPCAGDPLSGVAYSCPADGILSVLALVPDSAVTDVPDPAHCEDVPVLLHVTACKLHVGAVRRWLRAVSPYPEDVDTWSTALLMAEWDQVTGRMEDTPVLSMVRAS